MSDFPCDPRYETCPEEHDGAHYLDAADYMVEETFSVATYHYMYGMMSAGTLALSAYFYREYHTDVLGSTLIVTPAEGVSALDEDWAMATREISNWHRQIYFMWVVHGANFALWGLNKLFDGEGGMWHYLSFRMA